MHEGLAEKTGRTFDGDVRKFEGLFSNLLGNASEIDIEKVQAELEPVLVPGESIGRGFKIFRDMFIFTDHRLIMIDKEGITGSKVTYHSILYQNITQFQCRDRWIFRC